MFLSFIFNKIKIIILTISANCGNANSQFELGFAYVEGKGVIKNEIMACELFEKSAQKGNARAQYNMAIMHERGIRVLQDNKKIIEWLHMAAAQNNIAASFKIGLLYYCGQHGIVQDYTEALKWFQKAGEQGEQNACFLLGFMHEQGQGISKDYVTALEWYQEAAITDAHMQAILGGMYKHGKIYLHKNYAQAAEWFQKAAEQGHINAQMHLGTLYEKGWGVPQDLAKALKLYNKATSHSIPFKMLKQYNLALQITLIRNLQTMANKIFPDQIAIQQRFIKLIQSKKSLENLLDFIVNSNGNINVTKEDGVTLLMFACVMNNYNMVEKLIANGAEKNVKDEHATALHYAVAYSDSKLLIYLLQNGCSIDIPDSDGDYPEFWAVEEDRHIENLQVMCELKHADGSWVVNINRINSDNGSNLIETAKEYKATKCVVYLEQLMATRLAETSVCSATQEEAKLYLPSSGSGGIIVEDSSAIDASLTPNSSDILESVVTNLHRCVI